MLCVDFEPTTTHSNKTIRLSPWTKRSNDYNYENITLSATGTATATYNEYTQPLFYARFLYAFVLQRPLPVYTS